MYQILQICNNLEKNMYNNFDKSNNSGISNSIGPVSDWVTEKTGYMQNTKLARMAHTTVFPAKFWHLDVKLGSWALSMLGRCPHNYFAPTAPSRCAPDCLSNQQLQKSRGLPSQLFPLAKLFVEMSRQMLERLAKTWPLGHCFGIFFTPAHFSVIRSSWPFSCDNIYKDAQRYLILSSFLAQVFL